MADDDVPDWAREASPAQDTSVPDWARDEPAGDEPSVSGKEEFARRAVRGAAALPGMLVGAGVGAEVGGSLGALTGPLAPVAAPVGAIGGALVGGYFGADTMNKFNDWLLEKVGLKDDAGFFSDERAAAGAKQHPNAGFAGDIVGMLPAITTKAPAALVAKFGETGARLISAAGWGGFEAAQQGLTEGKLDLSHVLAMSLIGAAAPGQRAWADKTAGFGTSAARVATSRLPKPKEAAPADVTATETPPAAEGEATPKYTTNEEGNAVPNTALKDATDSATVPPNVSNVASESKGPPRVPDENIGLNEDNKAVRDDGKSGKYAKTATMAEPPTLTKGSHAPDIQAALLPEADMQRFEAAAAAKQQRPAPQKAQAKTVQEAVDEITRNDPKVTPEQKKNLTAELERRFTEEYGPTKQEPAPVTAPVTPEPQGPAAIQRAEKIPYEAAAKKAEAGGWRARGPGTGTPEVPRTPEQQVALNQKKGQRAEVLSSTGKILQDLNANGSPEALALQKALLHTADPAAREQAAANASAWLRSRRNEPPKAGIENPRRFAESSDASKAIDGMRNAQGKPVLAGSKTEATAKTRAVEAVEKTHNDEKFKPKENETPEQTRARMTEAMDHAKGLNGSDPLWFEPRADPDKRRMWWWLKSGRDYLKKSITHQEFLDRERVAYGGVEEYQSYRGKAQVERTGDKAVAAAESQQARAEVPIPESQKASSEMSPGEAVEQSRKDYTAAQEALAKGVTAYNRDRTLVRKKEVDRLAVEVKEAERRVDLAEAAEEKTATSKTTEGEPSKVEVKPEDELQKLIREQSEEMGTRRPAKKKPLIDNSPEARAKRVADFKAKQEAEGKIATEPTKMTAEERQKFNAKRETPVEGEKVVGGEEKRGVLDTIKSALSDETGSANVTKIDSDIKAMIARVQERMKPTGDQFAKTRTTKEDKYGHQVWQELHELEGRRLAHNAAVDKNLETLPASVKKHTEAIFTKMEKDGGASFTPIEKQIFDARFKDMYEQNQKLFNLAHQLAPDYAKEHLGPSVKNYMMHVVLNETNGRNMFGQGEKMAANPIAGTKSITRAASGPLMKRVFYEIEPVAGGKNLVVQPAGKDTLHVWDGTKRITVPKAAFEFEAGKGWTDPRNGKVYTMRDAQAVNIEAAKIKGADGKPIKYTKDAALAISLSSMHLAEFVDRLSYMETLKTSPQFKEYASRKQEDPTWERSKTKPFQDYYMEPALRRAIDQFSSPGLGGGAATDMVRKASRFVTGTLFWLPVAHVLNVQGHWAVARGFDWFKPEGWKNLYNSAGPAIKDIMEVGPITKEILRANGSLPSMNQRYGNPMEKVAKTLGHYIEKNPNLFDRVAKTMGLGGAVDLTKAIYKASNHALWMGNDMFYVQLYKEQRLKGLSPEAAVAHVERHFPSYRIPPQLLFNNEAGGLISKLMADPITSAYGRYHANWWTSWAHVAKALVGGTGEQRVEALGQLTVAAMMAYMVYPAVDWAWQKLTGNRFAEARRRGPLSIPSHVYGAAQGKEDFASALRSTVTTSPMLALAMELPSGKNWAGKPIVEPGTVARGRYDKALLQFGEWAGSGLLAPWGTVEQAAHGNKTLLETLRNQILDIKDTSPKAVKYQAGAIKRDNQRAKNPPGVLEKIYNKYGP